MKLKAITTKICVLCILLLFTTGCGTNSNPYIGSFSGETTSGDDVIVTFNADGTCVYNENGEDYKGNWMKNEYGIDMHIPLYEKYNPLKVSISQNGETIYVNSDTEGWHQDEYHRIK